MADIYYLPHEIQKKREEIALAEFHIAIAKSQVEREKDRFRKTKFIYSTAFFSFGMIFSAILFFLLNS